LNSTRPRAAAPLPLMSGLVVITPPSANWLMPYTFGTITQS
jgi:hypothetical protein